MRHCAACGERAVTRVLKKRGVCWACVNCAGLLLRDPHRFHSAMDEWARIMAAGRAEKKKAQR